MPDCDALRVPVLSPLSRHNPMSNTCIHPIPDLRQKEVVSADDCGVIGRCSGIVLMKGDEELSCKTCQEREVQAPRKAGLLFKPARRSFPAPRRGSREEPQSGFKGVWKRGGDRGWVAEIRPPKWSRKIFLGTYNTAREAAAAYDVGAFYSRKRFACNVPELKGTFLPLPSHLQLDAAEDREEIKVFVQKQAREAARKSVIGGRSAGPTLEENEEIENVEIKLQAQPAAPDAKFVDENKLAAECGQGELGLTPADMNTIVERVGDQNLDQQFGSSCYAPDAPMEMKNDYLIEASGPAMRGGDSMYQFLEERDGHEGPEGLRNDTESEDEGLSDGSSAAHGAQGEVTGASPCHGTNSNSAGRKRKSSGYGDKFTKLATFVNKQVENTLNSTLLPLVTFLRRREEDEQKHREKMLALEEEHLALKREKLLFKQRRDARSQPAPPRTRSEHKKLLDVH